MSASEQKQCARQVARPTDAGRSIGKLARLGLGQRDQLPDRLHRKVGIDDEHIRLRGHLADRREILQQVVRMLVALQGNVDGMTGGDHRQRVAVGGRLGHRVGADGAVTAGAVLHDHRLLPSLAQLLTYRARHDVGAAGRRERDDQVDRARRVIRCRVALREHARCDCEAGQGQAHLHEFTTWHVHRASRIPPYTIG